MQCDIGRGDTPGQGCPLPSAQKYGAAAKPSAASRHRRTPGASTSASSPAHTGMLLEAPCTVQVPLPSDPRPAGKHYHSCALAAQATYRRGAWAGMLSRGDVKRDDLIAPCASCCHLIRTSCHQELAPQLRWHRGHRPPHSGPLSQWKRCTFSSESHHDRAFSEQKPWQGNQTGGVLHAHMLRRRTPRAQVWRRSRALRCAAPLGGATRRSAHHGGVVHGRAEQRLPRDILLQVQCVVQHLDGHGAALPNAPVHAPVAALTYNERSRTWARHAPEQTASGPVPVAGCENRPWYRDVHPEIGAHSIEGAKSSGGGTPAPPQELPETDPLQRHTRSRPQQIRQAGVAVEAAPLLRSLSIQFT